MSLSLMKLKKISVAIVFTFTSFHVVADRPPANIFLMSGQYFFDDDANLDNVAPLTIGFGYDFTPKWGAEVSYSDLSSETDISPSMDVDIEDLQLDGLYYLGGREFLSDAKVRPFIIGGLGSRNTSFSGNSDTNEYVDLGFGAKIKLSEHFDFRVDTRVYHDLQDSLTDQGVNVGLAFLFGGGKKSSPAPAVQKQAAPRQEVVRDGDGDGVEDNLDKCLTTPSGVSVDQMGCALDSDKDGVADHMDNCPGTESIYKVDDKGCAQTLAETVEVKLNVKFANNSDKIESGASEDIRELAEFMNKFTDTEVIVEGYTDDRGSAQYNQSLSQRRAEAVRQVLISDYGIAASRIQAKGYGEENPIASNDTAEGRAANRRVVGQVSSTQSKAVER